MTQPLQLTIMHLKSCPKLVRSELRLDAVGVQTSSQRSGLFVSQQGGLLKSSNHGNFNNSRRLPLSVISTNTLRCGNTAKSNVSVASLRLKPPCSAALKLLPPECDTLTLHQTATEDAEIPLDIWTVIKPGHVREKIAIFASEGGRTKAGGSERSSSCSDHAEVSGLTRGVKVKGSREENCSAKRRRRSGEELHHHHAVQSACPRGQGGVRGQGGGAGEHPCVRHGGQAGVRVSAEEGGRGPVEEQQSEDESEKSGRRLANRFLIENYGVRPADSLWVCDPRYRDDPCKQCKRRYDRGDVSLCRWHHKPYCQALPYGPGYWMCCHVLLIDHVIDSRKVCEGAGPRGESSVSS
ncbi:putative F-box only protein 34 [Scophthalmus maximus]|uniref:Putative F-box only protein 34 n=1 Tax=Scophthalmus maximus TaxID=52904 RepID=A0A2U9CJM4_SCOMX|nr:putative F-box only protein 34 [Scophthalmus maximus]